MVLYNRYNKCKGGVDMNSYYLIARNREDNSFKVLSLDETWYLGKQKGRQNYCTKDNELEAIDMVTTRFSCEAELAKRLVNHNYIPNCNVDIFIASKKQVDGKNFIKFLEPIYDLKSEKIIVALRGIARTSLNGDFKDDKNNLSYIYDRIIEKVFNVDDFYCILFDGDTNVSKHFVEQLHCVREHVDVPYHIKESHEFGASSYSTVRNIVEAIERFNSLKCSSKDDRFMVNNEFISKNLSGRMAIVPELVCQLDENYIDGQLSLFSEKKYSSEKVLQATEKVVAEEFVPEKIHIVRSGVTNMDKKKAIYRVLRNSSKRTFRYNKDNKAYEVNYNLFKYPLLDTEKHKLDSYLTGNLPKYFSDYIIGYKVLKDAHEDGMTPLSETSQLERELESTAKKINNRFKSEKCLNMAYEWCMLYDGIKKRETQYDESQKVVSSDDKAKVYEKK